MHTKRRHPARLLVPLSLLVSLAGCSLFRTTPPADNETTIASLAGRHIEVQPEQAIHANEEQAAAAYREFLAAAPNAPERPQAMRRLGDLAMDSADRRLGDGAAPDFRAAIARYEEFLKAYPNAAGRDRVLYQLARAHEQGGDVATALKTLDALVQQYPHTAYADEAQFRRGELLFATRRYADAEAAYARVLASGADTPFRQRALYMQGWALFKQGRLDEALRPFFGVLDAKLGRDAPLQRGERELVDDTFRVLSITLSNLQGAASIAPLITSPQRLHYEHQVYEHLGALYLKQQRVKDAADTFAMFARQRPLAVQAPLLQARVIEIYAGNGFATLALAAKQDYVQRYGVGSEFQRANPEGWLKAEPLLKAHLSELARHHHALAQKNKDAADVQQAVHWYRTLLASFPHDQAAATNNFLLAELLTDSHQFNAAASEYEKTAYAYAPHARSADAGYAALLAYAAQPGAAAQRAAVASALRFGEHFAADARCGSVLAHAADQLFALGDGAQAASVAERALKLALKPAEQRTAWTVIAHNAFDHKNWAEAESAYAHANANALGADQALLERQAAAIYEQGEAARAAGRPRDAVAFFTRVASVAPNSEVRATAQFDAAAALIGEKDWAAAEPLLEDFRRRFPQHRLQSEVGAKLAAAYLAREQWSLAALEFERVAASSSDAELARGALWQAAELHDKGSDSNTARAYEAYLQHYPTPLAPALQARWRLAQLTGGKSSLAWLHQLVQAEATGGDARSGQTRTLAARASLALAAPLAASFRQVALVEPLKKSLKLKQQRLQQALQAYAAAADYGVAEISTAATFDTATLYQDFGRALLASERPKRLTKAQLEQYNVMLEEQAFPFEEKAITLHEANAERAAAGLYDEWVRASFSALATLKPARWARQERPDAGSPPNDEAIALRGKGQFAQARAAYEAAIAVNPKAAAPVLNLAILNDLYLGDRKQALEGYERFQLLVSPADGAVGKWLAELKSRKPATSASAATNATAGTATAPAPAAASTATAATAGAAPVNLVSRKEP